MVGDEASGFAFVEGLEFFAIDGGCDHHVALPSTPQKRRPFETQDKQDRRTAKNAS
jgi:hypothetical protein